MTGIFGPLVTTVDVDGYVLDTIKLWLPTYLTQIEREKELGHGFLARPKTYSNVLDDDTFPDYVLPAILVTTDGTSDDIERAPGGVHNAFWHFVVTAIVRGPDEAGTRQAASLYAASIRRLLLQKRSLGGKASAVYWNSELISPVADTSDNGRNLAAGIGDYTVLVNRVVQSDAGPIQTDPEEDPHDYDDWPLAEIVDIEVAVNPIEHEAFGPQAGMDSSGHWLSPGAGDDVGEDVAGVWIDASSDSPLVGVDDTGPWIEEQQ